MGSPAMLIALTVHCLSGYWFLPRLPRFLLFLLFWLSEVVPEGSGPELSLSSSMGLGGRRRFLLPVGAAYTDLHVIQVITCIVCFVVINRVFIT
jgi:hypothetical protein